MTIDVEKLIALAEAARDEAEPLILNDPANALALLRELVAARELIAEYRNYDDDADALRRARLAYALAANAARAKQSEGRES